MKTTRIFSKFFIGCLLLVPLLLIPMFTNFGSEAASDEPSKQEQFSVNVPEGGELPDLAIESFTIEPTNPHTYEPAKIRIVARNVGTQSVAGRRVYLYIDPPKQPPSSETAETTRFVVGVEWPPGDAQVMEYDEFTFDTPGCDHVVYAWVDPLGRIEESDETNNLKSIQVCVENEPIGPDAYEDDNSCDENNLPEVGTDGIAQVRNFNPVGDVDWVRFHATQGKEYQITAAGTGIEASPFIEMGESCDIGGSFGPTTSTISLAARRTGWHYVRLAHNESDYDPVLSTYELTIEELPDGTVPPPSETAPQISAISPAESFPDIAADIVITGTQFLFPSSAYLCPYQNDSCSQLYDCTQLLDTSWISNTRLRGIVPTNLNVGSYCLMVNNPTGDSHTLANTFAIEARNELNLPLLVMQPTPTPSPTPTFTPVPSQTPMPPPTATPMPVITNGDFETGNFSGWAAEGELSRDVRFGISPNNDHAALLGDPDLGEGWDGNLPVGRAYIEQQITVPSNGISRLSFWYQLISYDVEYGVQSKAHWDTLDVTINGVKEPPIYRTGNPAPSTKRNLPPFNSGWREQIINLSAYRGETVTLRFAVWNREYDGNGKDFFNTWAYIDDVRLITSP